MKLLAPVNEQSVLTGSTRRLCSSNFSKRSTQFTKINMIKNKKSKNFNYCTKVKTFETVWLRLCRAFWRLWLVLMNFKKIKVVYIVLFCDIDSTQKLVELWIYYPAGRVGLVQNMKYLCCCWYWNRNQYSR